MAMAAARNTLPARKPASNVIASRLRSAAGNTVDRRRSP